MMLRPLAQYRDVAVKYKRPRQYKHRTMSGFFDDPDKMAQEALWVSQHAENTYFSLNPLSDDLLARRLLDAKYHGWSEGRALTGWAQTALPVAIDLEP